MEDLLIDIFVGRDPEDLRVLDLYLQKQFSYITSGRTLASAVNELTSDINLRSALMVCTEGTSSRERRGVDQSLVLRDVADIQKQLNLTFPHPQILFDILLRRSDPHIAQINIYFSMREGRQ